ncbi:MAG TPA: histidine phosphatase family protein [Bradyrhizobium sp.]|nr:histidine phosphatase family protein [Bradyrhizobium sp.]
MIVFALRHADRKPDADDLSPAGVARAELLARMLAESGIRTAYCSDAIRTQRTTDPLQRKLGSDLEVVVVETGSAGGIAGHVKAIVQKVKGLPDNAVAAIVGHTNTVGEIVKGLTGRTVAPIADQQFDRLFVLSIPAAGAATVAPLRYGEAT